MALRTLPGASSSITSSTRWRRPVERTSVVMGSGGTWTQVMGRQGTRIQSYGLVRNMHLKLWVAAEHILGYLVPVNHIIRTPETQSDDPASFHLAEKNSRVYFSQISKFSHFFGGFRRTWGDLERFQSRYSKWLVARWKTSHGVALVQRRAPRDVWNAKYGP